MKEQVVTHSPEETQDVAAKFVGRLEPGAVVALFGDLGAGKTCWVQGMAAGLDVTQAVSSPTYTLVNEYTGRLPMYHLDLYRIGDSGEALDLGLDDYLFGEGITAIEWAERAEGLLPPDAFHIQFQPGDEAETRTITISREDAK